MRSFTNIPTKFQMYELIIDSFDPEPNIDKDYLILYTVRVTRKQRNVYVISGSFEVTQNWGNQMQVLYTISAANKLGPPIMMGNSGFCDFYNSKNEVMQKVRENAKMPSDCPLAKGVYHIKDFELNEKMLPPMVPQGQYKAYVKMNSPDGKHVGAYTVQATVT